MKTGIVVFAHGSRLEAANEAVRAMAAQLARDGGHENVDVAFLDCAPPDLIATAGKLASQGVDLIVVIPYFLTLGRHAAEDLPRIASEAERIHKVKIRIADALDGHPALARILLDRARQALETGEGKSDSRS